MPSREKSKSAPRSLNTGNIERFGFSFFSRPRSFENFRDATVPYSISRKSRVSTRNYIHFDSPACRSCESYVSHLSQRWLCSITIGCGERCFEPSFFLFIFPSPRQRKDDVRGNAMAYNALTYPNNLRRCVHLGCTETRVIPRVPCHVPRSKHL